MSDLETAQQIIAGNKEASEQFAKDYYGSVLRFHRHLTHRLDDAEDLTLVTLVKARDGMSSFRGDSSLRTWVHSIAFHEYTKWKRRQRLIQPLKNCFPYQEKRFELVGIAQDLLAALHQLTASQREVFLLHEIEQVPISEVASIVGIPEGTVKSRLFHAKQKLRELLSYCEEDKVYGSTTYEFP